MKRSTIRKDRRRGFTLIEMLVVLAILVFLMSMVGPRILGSRKKADISAAKDITVTDPFQWAFFRNVGYGLGSRFVRYFFARIERSIATKAGLRNRD